MHARRVMAAVAAALLALGVLRAGDVDRPGSRGLERIEADALPNTWRIHERVLSGGEPAGEASFRALRDLGVKTVISVDGAKPDVAAARTYGLRYIHLPHGYDGIPYGRVKELAKAVRDLEGPLYIHCHHGKHRSPAAAAVACVAAGLLEPEAAVGVLRTAGTSEHYRGLYRSAEEARPLDKELLDELRPEFPETATLPPMAEAMVEIERIFDRLKEIEAAAWRAPTEHPDLEPAHEALLLREQLTELLRSDDVRQRPQKLRELLKDSEEAGRVLERELREWSTGGGTRPAPQRVGTAFARITRNCAACHVKYRDVPLDEPER